MKNTITKMTVIAFAIISFCNAAALPNPYYQTLIGERVSLRPIQESDADALTPIYSDTASMKYFMCQEAGYSARWLRNHVKKLVAATKMETPSDFSWVITLEDAVIGEVSVCLYSDQPSLIYYCLNPVICGMGYATEATKLVVDFLKSPLYAIVHPDNTPSIKILEKLGFTITTDDRNETTFLYGKYEQIYVRNITY